MTYATDAALFGDELAPDDGLALLKNDAMRARSRPVAVAALFAWDLTLALVLAWPVAALVRGVYGRHPSGDAPLWSPGGLELGDFMQETMTARPALIAFALLVLAVGSLAGLVPTGALLASIAFVRHDLRAPPLRLVFARAVYAYRALVALFVATVGVQALSVLAAFFFGSAVSRALVARVGEARSDQLGVLVTLVVAAFAMVAGVTQDLARAAILRYRVGVVRGAELGWNTLRRTPVALVWSWTWRALAGWVPVVVGSLVADAIGGRAGASLVVLLVVHQLAIGSRVALHASWLAKALRSVDHAHRVVRREV